MVISFQSDGKITDFSGLVIQVSNASGHILHQPLGRIGGPTDTHSLNASRERLTDLLHRRDKAGIGIGFAALFKQHLAIRALPTGHKIDPIVLRGESLDTGQPIGHLPTNGIEVTELDTLRHPLLNRLHDRLETIQRFGRLREETNGPMEIQPIQVRYFLNDDSGTFRLPH